MQWRPKAGGREVNETPDNAESFVSHVAVYKARKAGLTGEVFLIGPGCKYGYWQCDGYTFRIAR
jgi:hypothetical protein